MTETPWAVGVAILSALGVAELLRVLLEKYLDRSTDATIDASTITDSALALLKPYREELDRLRAQIEQAEQVALVKIRDLEREVADLRDAQERHFALVHAHMAWDHQVIRELAARGFKPSDPPPLLPPPVL